MQAEYYMTRVAQICLDKVLLGRVQPWSVVKDQRVCMSQTAMLTWLFSSEIHLCMLEHAVSPN